MAEKKLLKEEQKLLIDKISYLKDGVRYYSEEIENNPNNDYIQYEFGRRRQNLLNEISDLRIRLKKLRFKL